MRSAGSQSMGRATISAPKPKPVAPAMLAHSQLPKWPVKRIRPLPLARAWCTLFRPWQREWAQTCSGLRRTRRGISAANLGDVLEHLAPDVLNPGLVLFREGGSQVVQHEAPVALVHFHSQAAQPPAHRPAEAQRGAGTGSTLPRAGHGTQHSRHTVPTGQIMAEQALQGLGAIQKLQTQAGAPHRDVTRQSGGQTHRILARAHQGVSGKGLGTPPKPGQLARGKAVVVAKGFQAQHGEPGLTQAVGESFRGGPNRRRRTPVLPARPRLPGPCRSWRLPDRPNGSDRPAQACRPSARPGRRAPRGPGLRRALW